METVVVGLAFALFGAACACAVIVFAAIVAEWLL